MVISNPGTILNNSSEYPDAKMLVHLFPKDNFPEEKLPSPKLYRFLRPLIHSARISFSEILDQLTHPTALCGYLLTPSHNTEQVFLCQFNKKKMISYLHFEMFVVTVGSIVVSHSVISYFHL